MNGPIIEEKTCYNLPALLFSFASDRYRRASKTKQGLAQWEAPSHLRQYYTGSVIVSVMTGWMLSLMGGFGILLVVVVEDVVPFVLMGGLGILLVVVVVVLFVLAVVANPGQQPSSLVFWLFFFVVAAIFNGASGSCLVAAIFNRASGGCSSSVAIGGLHGSFHSTVGMTHHSFRDGFSFAINNASRCRCRDRLTARAAETTGCTRTVDDLGLLLWMTCSSSHVGRRSHHGGEHTLKRITAGLSAQTATPRKEGIVKAAHHARHHAKTSRKKSAVARRPTSTATAPKFFAKDLFKHGCTRRK